MEVFVSGRRQGREHGRFPADCEVASQDGFALFVQGDRPTWGTPAKITIDGSDANAAAIEDYNEEHDAEVQIRQVKYLNNVLEQDHRAIRRQVRPMLGFKSLWSAAATLAGIELMDMIRKSWMKSMGRQRLAQQFYALVNWTFIASTGVLRRG